MSLGAGRAVRAGDGRQLTLGELLKSGGAGSVYRVREAGDVVAKIYHDYVDSELYQRKVAAMLSLSPELPDLIEAGDRYVQIAWPTDLLYAERSRFAGFLMPAVDVKATSELECVLQERQARMHGLPTGLGAKITLAANLAAVIAELHRQHHRVVDLKPVNLRFYPKSLYMAMLDCDGFSIQGEGERFKAPQYTPEYMAPEFQADGITVLGEEQQDRFALAVIVFQLLNFGIHPFTGRPSSERVPTDIPGRIAGRFHAYGLRPNAHLRPSLVSGHLAMPMELRQLFDRAFDGPGILRPSALEWASALRGYAQRSRLRLATCRDDGEHQHFAGLPCAACMRAELIAQTQQKRETAKSATTQIKTVVRHAGQRVRATTIPNAMTAARRAHGLPTATHAPRPWQRPPPPAPRKPPSATSRFGWWAISKFWPFLLVITLFGINAGARRLANIFNEPATPAAHYGMSAEEQRRYERLKRTLTLEQQAALDAAMARRQRQSAQGTPAYEVREPAPPANGIVPIASRVNLPRSLWPSMWQELEDARPYALGVAVGTTDGNGIVAGRSLVKLDLMLPREVRADAAERASATARFLVFISTAADLDTGDREDKMRALHAYLIEHPYDSEAACEWGWLALLDRKREYADDAFIRAIWADPNYAGGWYGLGATASDDSVRYGALVMSQSMQSHSADAAARVSAFTAKALSRNNINPVQFQLIEQHAAERTLPALKR